MKRTKPSTVRNDTVGSPTKLPTLFPVLFIEKTSVESLTKLTLPFAELATCSQTQ